MLNCLHIHTHCSTEKVEWNGRHIREPGKCPCKSIVLLVIPRGKEKSIGKRIDIKIIRKNVIRSILVVWRWCVGMHTSPNFSLATTFFSWMFVFRSVPECVLRKNRYTGVECLILSFCSSCVLETMFQISFLSQTSSKNDVLLSSPLQIVFTFIDAHRNAVQRSSQL